jgi:hypothetical protein
MQYKQYQRTGLSEMRPYILGEDLQGVSVAVVDNPETDMGMIARNPENHLDQWYVARKYFDDNLEEAKPAATNKRAFNTVENGTQYELPIYRVVDGKGIEETGEVLPLLFVRGSKLKDEVVEKREGTLHEHLLSAMIHDLKFKNGLVPSRETATAITNLEQALHWLEEREKARASQGVVGTYKPHQS